MHVPVWQRRCWGAVRFAVVEYANRFERLRAHAVGREGVSRAPDPPECRIVPTVLAGTARSAEPAGVLAQRYGIGTATIRKWRAEDRDRRERHLAVAVDQRSRSMHLAAKDDETERSAVASPREATAAFPFRLAHVLADNGGRVTPAFARGAERSRISEGCRIRRCTCRRRLARGAGCRRCPAPSGSASPGRRSLRACR